MKSQFGRLALAALLACAMLGAWQIAKAGEVCQCWQEDLKDIMADLREAPGVSTCNTICRCHGLPGVLVQSMHSNVCNTGWCIKGGGGFNGDGTVILFDAAELSILANPKDPESARKIIAVGSDKCS